MSNYTQSTFFTPKDSLTPGDPLKIIKGSDVDPEFSAISTAIATKVDTAGTGVSISTTTLSLDFSGLTDVAPAAADEFVFGDVSDSDNVRRATFAVIEAALNHDSLTGFVANEHVDHTSVSISTAADSGLTGGGDISSTRSLSVDISGTSTHSGLDEAADLLLIYDASAGALVSAPIDDAFNAVSGTVPESRTLTAGSGLTGGGDLSANRTFNVGAGDGISVAADSVALDINGLTSAVAVLSDSIAIYDASAGAVRKESLTDIKTLVEPSTATTSAEGIVELATQGEVDAGTDTSRVVTPSTLANYAGLGGSGGDLRITDTTGHDFRSTATWTNINDGTTTEWEWDLTNGEIYHLHAWLYITSATEEYNLQAAFSANHFSSGWILIGNPSGGYSPSITSFVAFNSDEDILTSIAAPSGRIVELHTTIEPSADGTVALQVKQDTSVANESIVEPGSWARLVKVS